MTGLGKSAAKSKGPHHAHPTLATRYTNSADHPNPPAALSERWFTRVPLGKAEGTQFNSQFVPLEADAASEMTAVLKRRLLNVPRDDASPGA